MNSLLLKIGEAFKVILAVLGIIGAYPDVKIDNLFVYRNFNDGSVINAQFSAHDLINPAVREIIESGIPINLIYNIETQDGKKTVYRGAYARQIMYREGFFAIDRHYGYNFDLLTNAISVSELIVLTNARRFEGRELTTSVEVLINCDAAPEIINLWGNKPRVLVHFTLGGQK